MNHKLVFDGDINVLNTFQSNDKNQKTARAPDEPQFPNQPIPKIIRDVKLPSNQPSDFSISPLNMSPVKHGNSADKE